MTAARSESVREATGERTPTRTLVYAALLVAYVPVRLGVGVALHLVLGDGWIPPVRSWELLVGFGSILATLVVFYETLVVGRTGLFWWVVAWWVGLLIASFPAFRQAPELEVLLAIVSWPPAVAIPWLAARHVPRDVGVGWRVTRRLVR